MLRTETSSLALYTLVQEIVLLCIFHLKTELKMIFLLGSTNEVLVHMVAGAFKTGVSKKGKRLPSSTVSEIMSVHTNTRENTYYVNVHVHWARTYRC